MNEITKTIAFLIFGVVLATSAYFVHQGSRPKVSEAAELIGKPFYESFTSAEQAKSLRVSAIDVESTELRSFSIKNKDGQWRIPSHHNYPADAAERLATTATSVMGIVREARAGELSASHKRYGLLDPDSYDERDEDLNELESYGKRITLHDSTNEVLVDYIIGHEVELDEEPEFQGAFQQEKKTNQPFYVRRADESHFYIVNLNIDLSTKFSDWIDPDLLEVSAIELRRIEVDSYELTAGEADSVDNIRPMKKAQKDQLLFSRNESVEPWALQGLDLEKEELDTSRVTEIVSVIDQMKIVGVRPKVTYDGQPLLTADLQVNQLPDFKKDPKLFSQLMERMQDEMDEHGFNFINDGGIKLVSQFGQINVGTSAGVLYQLQFGAKVSGDDAEIEFGGVAKKEEGNSEVAGENDEDNLADIGTAKNRFLMVRALFDATLLGVKPSQPIAPTPPVKPVGYVPLPASSNDGDKGEENENSKDTAELEGAKDGALPKEDAAQDVKKTQTPDRDPAFVEYDRLLKEYEEASMEFELIRTRYKDRIEKFNGQVEAGKKRVAELNDRFGKWYYVISATNLNSLQSSRADVVKSKAGDEGTEQPPTQPVQPPFQRPERPDISFELPLELQDSNESGEDGPEETKADGDTKTDPNSKNGTTVSGTEEKD